MRQYEVCGIVFDKYDNRRRFNYVVCAKSKADAYTQVEKKLSLRRGDIVRDVSITEIK